MQKPQPTSAPKSETRTEQNRLISLFLTSALAAILALGLMIPMAACQWLEQLAGPATTVYATSSDGTASTVLTAHNNQYDSTSLPVWLTPASDGSFNRLSSSYDMI
ncbi:MAG: hypothetical protein FWC59_02475, partial [Actinomycetia bacterium]|nr:hypothetical protein [Actinomycetes bacterium]